MRNEDSHRETNTVQSISRGAAILRMFSVSSPVLSLGEITEQLGRSKATAHRYVSVLRAEGLLRKDPETGLYTLGTAMLSMASVALAGLPVISMAEPIMAALTTELQETTVLSISDGDAPIVVRVNSNTTRLVTVSIRTGARLEKQSAAGRVFAAFGDERDHAWLRPSELERIRTAGVAVRTNTDYGLRTVAAPVFLGGAIAAALAVVGTAATVPDDPKSSLAEQLIAGASQIHDGSSVA